MPLRRKILCIMCGTLMGLFALLGLSVGVVDMSTVFFGGLAVFLLAVPFVDLNNLEVRRVVAAILALVLALLAASFISSGLMDNRNGRELVIGVVMGLVALGLCAEALGLITTGKAKEGQP